MQVILIKFIENYNSSQLTDYNMHGLSPERSMHILREQDLLEIIKINVNS